MSKHDAMKEYLAAAVDLAEAALRKEEFFRGEGPFTNGKIADISDEVDACLSRFEGAKDYYEHIKRNMK